MSVCRPDSIRTTTKVWKWVTYQRVVLFLLWLCVTYVDVLEWWRGMRSLWTNEKFYIHRIRCSVACVGSKTHCSSPQRDYKFTRYKYPGLLSWLIKKIYFNIQLVLNIMNSTMKIPIIPEDSVDGKIWWMMKNEPLITHQRCERRKN